MDTNHLTFLYYKNQQAVAAWRDRWAKQGGSFFRTARPLADQRDVSQILAWCEIEFVAKYKRGWAMRAHERVYGKPQKKVVNLTRVRFDRARQKAMRVGMGVL